MNDKVICKVMLSAYKDLEKMCNRVEERAWRCALGSIHNDVKEVADKIIQLNNEKIAYCNVKVIIDEAIKGIGRSTEIKGYYIDGLSTLDIIKQEQITEEAYRKRIERQRERLYQFIMDNYNREFLSSIIEDSYWLKNKYREKIEAEKPKIKP